MANIYMRLILSGLRSIEEVRPALRDDVRYEAKKRIGETICGVLLTEELYAEKFA